MKWYLLLMAGVCCISTSAILVSLAGADPTVAAFYRNLSATLFWLPFVLGQGLALPCQPARVGRERLARVHDWGAAGLLGLLGLFFAIDLWAWHRAIPCLGAGPATLMGNLQVIFVALLSVIILRQPLPRFFWPGSLLALLGIAMLTLSRGIGGQVIMGLFMGILTALTYSVFLILLKMLSHYAISVSQTLFWIALSTALFLLPPLYWEKASLLLPMKSLAILALHGLISSVLGWWLIVRAMGKLPVTAASTLLLMQPLLTHVWGDIFLGQQLGGVQIVGIFVALLGIRLANWQ